MISPYAIREADPQAPADRAAIERLFTACFPGREMIALVGWWWLVNAGDEPVAFAGLCRSPLYRSAGYLCRAGVMPGHRGRGLQPYLIDIRCERARREGFTEVVSNANRDNAASLNNFVDSGFRIFWPERPWDDERAVYVRKVLT